MSLVGDALHMGRRRRRWSLRDVREVTGISISTLSRIEDGKEGCFYNVAVFAVAVGVDLNELAVLAMRDATEKEKPTP